MNDLLQMRLFGILSEPSPATNEEMKSAYECFTEQIRTVSQSGKDFPEVFRMLDNPRIELVFLESLYRYEQGEKRPKICLSTKSIGIC